MASLALALSFSTISLAAGNKGRINVDVECRCPDPVGQSFCADFKKQVSESAAYKLANNLSGYGLGVHFACVDMWKGIDKKLSGHMSAVSVAFTIDAERLPGEVLEDNSVFRVGVDAIPEMSRQIVSALGQIVAANASLFERLSATKATSGASTGSGPTSGASTGSAEDAKPLSEPSAAASTEAPAEDQAP
jgi:hypothetical protein